MKKLIKTWNGRGIQEMERMYLRNFPAFTDSLSTLSNGNSQMMKSSIAIKGITICLGS